MDKTTENESNRRSCFRIDYLEHEQVQVSILNRLYNVSQISEDAIVVQGLSPALLFIETPLPGILMFSELHHVFGLVIERNHASLSASGGTQFKVRMTFLRQVGKSLVFRTDPPLPTKIILSEQMRILRMRATTMCLQEPPQLSEAAS